MTPPQSGRPTVTRESKKMAKGTQGAKIVLALCAAAACAVSPLSESTADAERRLIRLLTPCANACSNHSYYGGLRGDGIYLMCQSAMETPGTISAALSFGVRREDLWGYDVNRRLKVPVHGFDCFSTKMKPVPAGVDFQFHPQCIGARTEKVNGKEFLSVDAIVDRYKLARPRGAAPHLLFKMDIEGFEYSAVPAIDPHVLKQFHTLVFEVHGITRPGVPIMGQVRTMTGKQRGPWGVGTVGVKERASEVADFVEYLQKAGFVLTTVHSNNLWGAAKMSGRVVPNFFDVTFVHRDALPAGFQCEPMTPAQMYAQHRGHNVWKGEEVPALMPWPDYKGTNWHLPSSKKIPRDPFS